MKLLRSSLLVAGLLLAANPTRAEDPPPFLFEWGSFGEPGGQFIALNSVTVGGGRVYTSEGGLRNNRIQVFSSDGTFLSKWGTIGIGDGQFQNAWGVAVDASGNVYVVDSENHRVQKFANDGTFLTKWGGFRNPTGIAVDGGGNVYVVEFSGVQKFTSEGAFLTRWGSSGTDDGQFRSAQDVAVDRKGNVYVTDMFNNRIQKFTSDGVFLTKWGIQGQYEGQFNYPMGIAIDPYDNVYVAEQTGRRIQKFTSDGTYLSKWRVRLSEVEAVSPIDVAADDCGNVYVVLQSNVIRKYGPTPVPVSLDLSPNTLNLSSRGRWVTGILEPDPPASPTDINVASILLNGSVPVDASAPSSIGDADEDGRPDLTVEFDRSAVGLTVEEGEAVPITVSGKIGNACFRATDVIRVIRPHLVAPRAGSVLQGGSATEIQWDADVDVQAQPVAVFFSSDDGVNWTLVAGELPNTGSYIWRVPTTVTDQAKIALVPVESADESGFDVNGVLGMSDRFAIAALADVGGGNLGFALHGALPNPGRGLSVTFSLANAAPATLAVYDVSGREVSVQEVGRLGAGRHVVSVTAPGALAPDVYLVHLKQGNSQLIARAVVIQ